MHESASPYLFTVESACCGQRLDSFLALRLRQKAVSREKIKKAVLSGACKIGAHICREPALRVEAGQEISLDLSGSTARLIPEQGELVVLYEDKFISVLDKPAGLTVHPCPSCPKGTLVHRLAARFPELLQQEGERPGIVHRLDKDTSGLLLTALSEEARLRLAEAFAAREIKKEYLALVRGVPEASGTIEAPIGRDPSVKVRMAVVKNGRPALTQWQVVYADDRSRFSLLHVRIHTGRTHQIRVHMASIGHPLWGDALYGPQRKEDPCSRQMLHAWRLAFTHPFSGKLLSFCCRPPEDFRNAVSLLDQRMQRVVLTGMPGCGKSALLRSLEEKGYPTWSADAVVLRLYEPGQEGWQLLYRRYGDRFVPDARKPVDRRALAEAFAGDPNFKREVEKVIHQLVRADLEAFWARQEKAGAHRAVAEVPLWFESGWKAEAGFEPILVGIRCDQHVRYARLAEHRRWSRDFIATVDSWQWDETRKLRGCALLVDNTGTVEQLSAAAATLLQQLDGMESERCASQNVVWERLVELPPEVSRADTQA